MNIPINHHYVSQCHQREFFNAEDKGIYVYDKTKSNIYKKLTTKSLFSEDNLNTKSDAGRIDYTTLEKELKVLFEDDFPKLVARINKFVVEPQDLQDVYENVLGWFTLLGIIGELRHPLFKKQLDEVMTKMATDTLHMSTGISREKIVDYLKSKKDTPYNNDLGYIETALRIFERMEPMEYELCVIETDSHFILPDTSCFQIRGPLQKYLNPFINEIIQIGIPLTDKIFLIANSSKLGPHDNGIQYIRTAEDEEIVDEINSRLLDFAKVAVACKDEKYLRTFIESKSGLK
jgi:hypothetical protein